MTCPSRNQHAELAYRPVFMFLKFFGLREQPFGVTPDPRFLYLSSAHREALASLFYGIEAKLGFLALIAKPGMGKTTLLFHLLEEFRSSARTAFLFQTQCTSREFMRLLLIELGCETDHQDLVRIYEEFNKYLLQEAKVGNRFIIVVDEAQNLDDSVLETVRLLSNFETPRVKLLQIVLAGQPELADKLASGGLVQLRQRISLLSRLKPLSPEETNNYIQHRLSVAGYVGGPLFTSQALAIIADFTEGIPRNINTFCFNALSLACALRQKTIHVAIAQEVIADLDFSQPISQPETASTRQGVFASQTSDRRSMEYPAAEAEFRDGSRKEPVPSISAPVVHTKDQFVSSPAGGNMTFTEARAYMEQVVRSLKHSQS
jgi:general secretion pathway protein A